MRDYNQEIKDTPEHKYAYDFDIDVMHRYMVRTFAPFFVGSNVLELGSFRGEFTERLLPHFTDVTCVEVSGDALADAKRRLGSRVKYVHGTFEDAKLPRTYDNIVLTHVLEHIDDPVGLLSRIRTQWLAKGGRLFVVCPNGNAPSRQIAVRMGLLSHNAVVTSAESKHGHRITYTFDTLERDALAAGLSVLFRTGVFFKALANFQWDRVMKTDIISKEYLEGCYRLGQIYPDLCASICLVCGHDETRK
jgi:SAM-dependent methyltransferase